MAKKSKNRVGRHLTHVELGPVRKKLLADFRAKKQLDNTPVTSDEKAILQLLDTHPELEKV